MKPSDRTFDVIKTLRQSLKTKKKEKQPQSQTNLPATPVHRRLNQEGCEAEDSSNFLQKPISSKKKKRGGEGKQGIDGRKGRRKKGREGNSFAYTLPDLTVFGSIHLI